MNYKIEHQRINLAIITFVQMSDITQKLLLLFVLQSLLFPSPYCGMKFPTRISKKVIKNIFLPLPHAVGLGEMTFWFLLVCSHVRFMEPNLQ